MKQMEQILEWGGRKRDMIFLAISAVALGASIFGFSPFPFSAAWIAIVLCGIPILLEAALGLIKSFDIKADVLVSIALIASVIIGEEFAAGEVAFIMQLGALLEELTVARARAGIERLVRLTPRTARRVTGLKEEIIKAEEVKAGDILRVLPGETIPVDGVILSGRTCVDQAVMTGESLPVDKEEGDPVSSGTVNQFGSFDMKAERVGEDSSIQRMIRLVQSADAGKAKIVGIADRWATWIVVIALTAAALTGLITGQALRAVTILVVFCPCALVLATPTAVMAGIGNAAKHGFLIREGDALERLSEVSRVCFDKTGTLTYGRLTVTKVRSLQKEISETQLYAYAAAAEQRSEHPLGRAVVLGYESTKPAKMLQPEQFSMLPGRGVIAEAGGKEILAGSQELLLERAVEIPERGIQEAAACQKEGMAVIWIAVEGKTAGFLALSDTLRPEAAEMVGELKREGIIPVLLTGDHEAAARYMADRAGIKEVYSGCLPEDKLSWIEECQKNKKPVCMIGDGINDAPALKKSWVGIAMGGIGSDIAADAADLILISEDLKELPHLFSLARRMMTVIKCNLTFSMTLNFISILLAMTGLLNPVAGALVHNAGSVIVIIHSAFLLKWRRHRA